MSMIVVRSERSLGALDRRIFREETAPADAERLRAEIREMNPEVDLEDLRPGEVLRLPRAPELRPRSEGGVDDAIAEGLGMVVDAAGRDLEVRSERAAARSKTAAAERRAAAKLLGNARVRFVVEKLPETAMAVGEASKGLEEDAAEAGRRAAAAEQATAAWREQLEVVQRLLP